MRSSLSRTLMALIIVGLLARVLFVVLHQRPLISDELEYYRLATGLIETGTFGYDGIPTAYRPFLYPAFVSVILRVAPDPIAVKIIQALLDVLTGVLLLLMARNQSQRIQAITAGAWLLYLPAILYVNVLLSESVFTFLLVLTAYLVSRVDFLQLRDVILVGCLLGLLALMKPAMLLVILLFPLFFIWVRLPLKQYSWVVVGSLMILGPWIARNTVELGKPTLATNGGINLLIGNNPNATGGYAVSFPPEYLQDARTELEADGLAYRHAIRYITEHPGRFIVNGIKKLAHLFSSEGGILVWSFHSTPDNAEVRFSQKYAEIPILLALPVNLSTLILFFAGFVGIFAAPRSRMLSFTLLLLVAWIITHFVFFGGSRFHFPLMPLFAFFAAPVLSDPVAALNQMTSGRRLLAGFFCGIILAIWSVELSIVLNA